MDHSVYYMCNKIYTWTKIIALANKSLVQLCTVMKFYIKYISNILLVFSAVTFQNMISQTTSLM